MSIIGKTDVVAEAVAACLENELSVAVVKSNVARTVDVLALGTTAGRAAKSQMLDAALAGQNLSIATTDVTTVPGEAFVEPTWDLGLVLSPFKAEVGAHANRLTPSAARTGIVDTLLRTSTGVVGLNSNSWALAAAGEVLLRGLDRPRILVLGTGGTTHSALLGLARAHPDAELFVSGRRPEATCRLAERYGVTAVAPADTAEVEPSVVINATTWGETDESEASPFGFPAGELFAPGRILFDLNNRHSALQIQALAAGCAVMSGTLMQRITHACRAAGAAWALDQQAKGE
ncbi:MULTISPECIES: hypothetical protein [Gordonia]|jgi:shikimate dehydrogenase|uniref:hypothetical protein n=1 Tax=Gordonia TaxID=2053 RepID=UPI00244B99F0|nr:MULTISPECIES: hypothetical protein [Gordonia]MDH3020532.1 hypothetical protein [Gordonia alkanivorans]MDH3049389.1 hypothetical protein [Gordonia alkanivorans]MDJ0007298.1 hypothetical protein [Gordonia alkanivorans]MDJ0027685.1 hypothetical protein [Gordonia alkanivorans]MDJ0098389.1 hypothetical protein [Gordonia alkanivorans]